MNFNYTKLTDKPVTESVSDSDKVIVNVDGSVKQATVKQLLSGVNLEELTTELNNVKNNLQSQINTANNTLDIKITGKDGYVKKIGYSIDSTGEGYTVTHSDGTEKVIPSRDWVTGNLDSTKSNLQSQIDATNNNFNNYLKLDGSAQTVNIVSNLNHFWSGIGVFQGTIDNIPTNDFWLVIAGGGGFASKQIAFNLWNNSSPKARRFANGVWSSWENLGDSRFDDINTEISNLKKSVSDGKASVVSAITQMLTGVMGTTPDSLATDASFSDISNYLTSKQLNLRANDSKIFTSSTEDTVFFPKTNKVYAFITMCAKSTTTKDISLYITTSDGQHPEATCLQSWDGLANSSVAVSNRLYLIENCKDATVNIEFSGSVNVTGNLTVLSMNRE